MADVYEKNLAQKSSLTTSDFIRVVGSDNVSYKQLVSGVMTAMGLDAIKTPASEVSNIDTATSTGFYKYGSGASGTKPNSSGGVLIVVAFNASYSQQVAIPYDTNNSSGVYKRVVYSGTPTAWQLQPTRAEVVALKNRTLKGTLNAGSSKTFTLSDGAVVLVGCNAANTTRQYVGWYIGSASNIIDIYKGANVSVTSATNNQFTISNIGSSGNAYYEVTVFANGITVTVS